LGNPPVLPGGSYSFTVPGQLFPLCLFEFLRERGVFEVRPLNLDSERPAYLKQIRQKLRPISEWRTIEEQRLRAAPLGFLT
jgi:hypothetical protein